MNTNTATPELKYITLYDLEADKSTLSVWVMNVMIPKGNINLGIADGSGNITQARVLASWIPTDLTNQVPRGAILSNPNFRQLVAKRALRLVSHESALEFLKTPDAAAEYERIYKMANIAEIGSSEMADKMVTSKKNEVSGEISPFAMNIAHSKDQNEEDVIRSLRNSADVLSKKDYQYISQNSIYEKVKSFCAEKAL